jgi:hypothetical protein
MGWVTTNLGRDPKLAEIAATAATETAMQGQGFNNAAAAARLAWADAANRGTSNRPAPTVQWEKLAVGAWIWLTLAWLWPITPVILNRAATHEIAWPEFVASMAFMDVFAIPVFAILAIVFGHVARHRIKRTGDRGAAIALVALILGYLTLLGSPISIVGFIVGADVIPPIAGGFGSA